MSLDFNGAVVAVTGAATGFGRAIAQRFARHGARVFATDRDGAGLAETASLPGIGQHVMDLTDRAAVAAWVAGIERETGGPLGVLVNNAGGVLGRQYRPIEETAFEDWDAILRVNLDAAFAVTRAAAAGMKRAGRGRIINISSGAGLKPSRTGIQAYTSAKHAVIGLTRQLAQEFGPHGITVNAVAPGLFPVSAGPIAQWEGYGPEGQQRVLDGIALRRLGTADDIAKAVMFFASDLADYVTGQVLPVNGGSS
ncbi:SDR family NAD(P)-dependent oxidoreductase [Roseomonas sp. E05]|uniref:SDR family NAD(P)-dependent oxidoreductase n=1 Tax=Roseomonas sp. E05 TaxID=3046310 RepID=UPI0024BAF2C0|nr:SDR family NAD(P)-dependent oxidoreductase [Roseomonas sp. E05]MDJ0388845.1 SDR family NAD(P)-dependent oxidoreductase [Roseomonas sp. E05]